MIRVAGHSFEGNGLDVQCTNVRNGEQCKMTRSLLFTATEQDVGKPDFSCQPNLTQNEYNEILEEKKAHGRRVDAMMDAIRELSS
jgi:hypothetical protein